MRRLDELISLMKHRGIGIGVAILLLFFICAIFANVISPYGYRQQDLSDALSGMSLQHIFGTDHLGRDVLSRIIYGTQVTAYVMLLSLVLSASIGIPLGLFSGYSGGIIDQAVMRIMDILLAFPPIIFAFAIVAVMGASLENATIAASISCIAPYCRFARGQMLSAKEEDYVQNAKAIGVSNKGIIFRHILPNIAGPILVQMVFSTCSAILVVSSLSFLGLGSQPPTPDWGTMIYEGRAYMRSSIEVTLFPGLSLLTVCLALNIVGEGLSSLIDSRLRRAHEKF
jgi:peptide/nickel transport system permease protein